MTSNMPCECDYIGEQLCDLLRRDMDMAEKWVVMWTHFREAEVGMGREFKCHPGTY